MKLESPAFTNAGPIPTKYTCEGDDVAPSFTWRDVPAGTESLALIIDDPDAPDPKAPKVTWVHWVVFNIPISANGLHEGQTLPSGASQGLNDWKRAAYGGPCPPIGRHRYFHKLYALNTRLQLKQPTKAELEAAMHGHIVAKAELVGTYEKHGR